jgi:hypothetical protein
MAKPETDWTAKALNLGMKFWQAPEVQEAKSAALESGEMALRLGVPAPVQGLVPSLSSLESCVATDAERTLKCLQDQFLRNLQVQAAAGDPIAQVLWELGRAFLPKQWT